MKKCEIYRLDPTTKQTEVITLTDQYAFLPTETIRMINEAEGPVFVCISFGESSVLLPKGEIQYIVTSEVKDV